MHPQCDNGEQDRVLWRDGKKQVFPGQADQALLGRVCMCASVCVCVGGGFATLKMKMMELQQQPNSSQSASQLIYQGDVFFVATSFLTLYIFYKKEYKQGDMLGIYIILNALSFSQHFFLFHNKMVLIPKSLCSAVPFYSPCYGGAVI